MEFRDRSVPPREDMRRLGGFVQPLLTEITGKALSDEAPLIHWTWWMRLLVATGLLVSSTAASVAIVQSSDMLLAALLPITWLGTVSALRTFQTTFVHHASHNALTGIPWLDALIGEALSLVAWIQPQRLYADGHAHHHRRLALSEDPDLRFLVFLGFRPGLTVKQYWRQLFFMMLSPVFHARYFFARTKANLIEAAPLRRLASAAFLVGMVWLAVWTGAYLAIAIAWIFPATLLYQVSGLLQVLSEHHWVRERSGSAKEIYAKLTIARYMGEALPDERLTGRRRIIAWLTWTMRMLLIHIPARFFVVTADLSSHDWHHRRPNARLLWPNHAYARRDDATKGRGDWPAYAEHWGLKAALHCTLVQLSTLPRSAVLGQPITYQEQHDGLLGM